MTNAYQCDRCKEYFKQTVEPCHYYIIVADSEEKIHLCDSCTRNFKYWWKTVVRARTKE